MNVIPMTLDGISVDTILSAAVSKFGEAAQIDKAIEEMAELTQALVKDRIAGFHHPTVQKFVYEELADVLITLSQLMLIYNNESVLKENLKYKMARLGSLTNDIQTASSDDFDKFISELFDRGMEYDIISIQEKERVIGTLRNKYGV